MIRGYLNRTNENSELHRFGSSKFSEHSPSTNYFHKQSSGNKILKWREWWVTTWLTQAVDFWICTLTAEPTEWRARELCARRPVRDQKCSRCSTRTSFYLRARHRRGYVLQTTLWGRVVHLSTFSLKLCSVEDLKMLTSSKSIWKITWSNWIKGHMWLRLIYIVMGCAIIRSAGTTRWVTQVPGNFSVRLGNYWEELKYHIHFWYSNS